MSGKHNKLGDYTSFTHVYDHIFSSYFTSLFAKNGKSAYILMFDGGGKAAIILL